MIWREITDYVTIDFYGSAPGGLLYAKRSGGSYTSQRVLYCNLPRVIDGLVWPGGKRALHLLRLPGLSGDNVTQRDGTYYLGATLHYELYADTLDLANITATDNPDGTGDGNSHALLHANRYDTRIDYARIVLENVSVPGDMARSMRLSVSVNGDLEARIDAPGGIEMSEAAISYTP